jgi:hypothetical protein
LDHQREQTSAPVSNLLRRMGLVAGGKPKSRTITTRPFLIVEVLSPDDRMSEMQERIDDCLDFGVKYVLDR